jgi:hypothetical protein
MTTQHGLQFFSQVKRLISLFLCIPVATCTAERSFSSLRRLKVFLRSTMSQQRLNHLIILHVHKEITDCLDLKQLCNEFIRSNECRRKTFCYVLKYTSTVTSLVAPVYCNCKQYSVRQYNDVKSSIAIAIEISYW